MCQALTYNLIYLSVPSQWSATQVLELSSLEEDIDILRVEEFALQDPAEKLQS